MEDNRVRYLGYVLIVLCLAAIHTVDQPKLSPAEQEILDVRNARTEASNNRDLEAWSRYIADDCIFSSDAGDRLTKAQVSRPVTNLPREYDYSVDPREAVVHVYGDAAVLNLRFTVHERFTDSDIVSEMRATETYVKRNGAWILVARQWGKIPVNYRKPAAVDTHNYKDYAGQYEWRPVDDLETISVKDGKLWTQTGKDAAEEMLPTGGEAFFLKGELGTNTFIRDAQGRVTGYTYRDADGQEVHVRKIR
jgi:ketosteroid isomerase-like protein